MAIDSRAKRAIIANLFERSLWGKGVTPDATPDEFWRASVAGDYAVDQSSGGGGSEDVKGYGEMVPGRGSILE